MKKLFKTLLIAVLAVAAVLACAFAAGCKKDDETPDVAAAYTFIIKKSDGTALNGQTGGVNGGKVVVGICMLGDGGMCVDLPLLNIYPDESGKVTLTQAKVNEAFQSSSDVTQFTFHVKNVPGHKADCEINVDGAKEYTITLTAA